MNSDSSAHIYIHTRTHSIELSLVQINLTTCKALAGTYAHLISSELKRPI
uniref:Uncharacterized protein n=1 Tax=Setaria italica TaxID=4555 RepID=K4ANS1_SETIT